MQFLSALFETANKIDIFANNVNLNKQNISQSMEIIYTESEN